MFENEQFINLKNKHAVFHNMPESLSRDQIFIKYYEHNSELYIILLSSYIESVYILQEDGSILFRLFNREMNERDFSEKIYILAKCNNFLKFKEMIRDYDYN